MSVNLNIVFIIIYNSADYYPPTLNAIEVLSEKYDKVVVIELSNHKNNVYQYRDNVVFHRVHYNSSSYSKRIQTFFQFTNRIHSLLKKEQPRLVIFYDAEAALSVYIASLALRKKPLLWYHIHDTADKKYLTRFTLNYFALRWENKIMKHLAIFSLPSDERKGYFDLSEFKGRYALIPNYPLKKLFLQHYVTPAQNRLNIVYQGRICAGRGIEEIINLFPCKMNGQDMHLILIGFVSAEYRKKLDNLISERNAETCVSFTGIVDHRQLPVFTSKCQIGLAIYTAEDNMHSTLGTASNKAYEYTACGIPFLYYKNSHFDHHFSDMPWAVSTDLSNESLLEAISSIALNYQELSTAARENFISHRNFENVFLPVVDYTEKLIRNNVL